MQRALHVTERPSIFPLTHRYLCNYPTVFYSKDEKPTPSWKAFKWILEDVGLSRQIGIQPKDAHDVIYMRICHGWSPTLPVTVTNDPRFCNCPRHWKWPPQAFIDILEYSWPIQGVVSFTKHVLNRTCIFSMSTRNIKIRLF